MPRAVGTSCGGTCGQCCGDISEKEVPSSLDIRFGFMVLAHNVAWFSGAAISDAATSLICNASLSSPSFP